MREVDIIRLKEKLEKINDSELTSLVSKLIFERNDLLEAINIDHLTGVYNRKILEEIKSYSVAVMCDIDDFKSVNDKYGHELGDFVLKVVASTLLENVRYNDIVCRYGGDEFSIVFNNCPQEIVVDRIKKIQDDVRNIFNKKNIDLSLSVGIAEKNADESLKQTLSNADMALYESKANGKDTITLYDENEKNLLLKEK